MLTNSSLKNKIAIVTGGSAGIGKAIVESLLREGARVVNADVEEDITHRYPNAENYFYCKTNIASGKEIQQLYDFVKVELGTPNILICNAGRGIHEKLAEGDPEKWFTVININLMGTLRVLRSFLPDLLNAADASIVFISSVAAKTAYEYGGVYGATKAAIDMVAETLRLEVKEKIKITVVAPGVIATDFFKNRVSGVTDIQSLGVDALSPAEVADAVLFTLTRPHHQVVNHITLRPYNQLF